MRAIRAVAIIILVALTTACFNEGRTPQATSETASPPAAGVPRAEPAEPSAEPFVPPAVAPGVALKPMRDGEYDVGDGNRVTVDVIGAGIQLGAVTPGPGWTQRLDEASPTDIEIDFLRPGQERNFSADLERGVFIVKLAHDIKPAQPGNFPVGDAGSVDVNTGPGITVTATGRPNEGWTVFTDADPEGDEVDLVFTRANERWKLKADRNNIGQVEVEVDYEISGTPPA